MNRLPQRCSAVVAAALLLATTAACGSGRDAMTYRERAMGEQTNDAVGSLALRNVAIQPSRTPDRLLKAGTTARATITVVSEDTETDRLRSVTSPAAQSVRVVRRNGDPVTLTVPPLGSTGDAVLLELRGLTRDLRAGEWIPMTLTFERNGSKEVLVPVAAVPTRERQEQIDREGTEEGEDERGRGEPASDSGKAPGENGPPGSEQGDGHGGESGSQG